MQLHAGRVLLIPIIYCESYKPVLAEVRPPCRSRSPTREKNNDQKTRRQDRRHHWRDRRAWVALRPTFSQGRGLCLHSAAARGGTPAFGVSAASKAASRSFVRAWTTDLKDGHIRSNVVSPGPMKTPLTIRQSADVTARIVSTVPMGRMGQSDELAKAALYLASDA